MVDTPRFGKKFASCPNGMTGPKGPDFLFLTHVDDTADHGKWVLVQEFPHLQRIFHQGDTGRHETYSKIWRLFFVSSRSKSRLMIHDG